MSYSLVGQILEEQYRVEAFVGSGGMGVVYRVWDLKRNAALAMKVLHAELAEDDRAYRGFAREARALQKLAHPNIVPFYGLQKSGKLSLLLEGYVDGPSLKNIMRRQKGQPVPLLDILTYLRALSASLGYTHVHGVIHCDVKPGNVMVDQGGSVFLTDFGIARHAESTTTTLGIAGSPAYMAPEQIKGLAVSPATDVYALGVLLFEMLTGRRPLRGTESETESAGTTAGERMRFAHLHLPPPDVRALNPAIPEQLAQVVYKALAKEPGERFQSVQEMFQATLAASGQAYGAIPERINYQGEVNTLLAEAAPPVGAPPVARPKARPVWILAVGVVGVVILALSLWFIGRGSSPEMISGTTERTQTVEIVSKKPSQPTSGPRANPTARPTTLPTVLPTRPPAPTDKPTPRPLPTHTERPLPTASVKSYYPLSGCSPSRLYEGDWAYVSFDGGFNAIRYEPDTRPVDNIIGRALEGESMEIIGGPRCNYDYVMWKVRTASGLVGWTPETDGKEFWLIPGSDWSACPGAPKSRLQVGNYAAVTYDPPDPNNVRRGPNLGQEKIGEVVPGERMEIIGGPSCAGQYVWWEIKSLTSGLRGWTAEGDREAYWLIPLPKK